MDTGAPAEGAARGGLAEDLPRRTAQKVPAGVEGPGDEEAPRFHQVWKVGRQNSVKKIFEVPLFFVGVDFVS
jgi:hypothetical protein